MATKKISKKQQKLSYAKAQKERYLALPSTANNKRLYKYWTTRYNNLKKGK